MIDWGSLGPANSPTASTPETTVPVAPAAPGSLAAPTPSIGAFTGNQTQPQDKIARMFGAVPSANGAEPDTGLLGGVVHAGAAGVIKPVEVAATVLSHIPLSWWPGGADETFNKYGEQLQAAKSPLYQQWQLVNAAANGDILGGGNKKADFNMEYEQYLDDQRKDSTLGTTPTLAMGMKGVGSLGGEISHFIQGWLGLPGNTSTRLLGGVGFFDPGTSNGATYEQMKQKYDNPDDQSSVSAAHPVLLPDEAKYAFDQLKAGKFTEGQARSYITANVDAHRNRVEEAASRLDRGAEISDVEKKAVEAWQSGAWSEDHALDYIVSHGQSVTRDLRGQILGGLVTDPLTYATVGAGAISKAGVVGAQVAESGLAASNTYEKMGTLINSVQQSQMGPAFRLARGLIDPLAVMHPSSVQRAVIDLRNGSALEAFQRAYGPQTVTDMRAMAREAGATNEVDSAMASYSIDQANLMVARKAQQDIVDKADIAMSHANVDDTISPMVENAGRNAVTELTDHMMSVAKNTFTPEEEATLAGRLAATFTKHDISYWAEKVKGMSFDLKSALHAITYKRAEVAFEEARAKIANYAGELPLNNAVLMSTDTLDNVRAEGIVANIRKALDAKVEDLPDGISAATAEWNAQARRFPAMGNIGYATGGKEQVKLLVDELEKTLKAGGLSRRVTEEELNDGAIRPIRDMLDRNVGADGKHLWNVGFRPDETVAWGLKNDPNTGLLMIDRDPTISHVVDAVPGRQPFSDTTRNVLGQIIGKSKAERINGPIDSIEAFINTARDGVTGRRLVTNIERRFERSTFDAGIPKSISKEIFTLAREVAGLEYTTVRGIRPDNLWNAIHEIVPRDLVLKDGSTLNIHTVMDHLLQAAEGDLRIMGVSSVLSQRARNALRTMGDGSNWSGQMTVTMYNKLRYSQPTFLIQRVTDAPYYSILYGVTPVGKAALKGENAELARITENLGRTQMARYFSMDMPEFATRANFTAGIKTRMQEMGLRGERLQRILDAPDEIIANNMTNMLHARLGDIFKGALENLTAAAAQDPALKAEMLQAQETLMRSVADWRRVYSEAAGRVLDDNEVAFRYIKDQLRSWRDVVNSDGTLDFTHILHDGERSMPDEIANIGTIRPDDLARKISSGYENAAALRRDVTGHMEKDANGGWKLIKGEHDLPWLEEQLRTTVGAHPDYTRRAMAYFGDTWDGFWHRLSLGVDKGGLDISGHYAKEAQDLIAISARNRGMDPWEYLSGVMSSNLGTKDLETHMGQFVSFLKSGKAKQPLEEWTKMFRATLDPSAQAKLIQEFEAAVPVESVIKTPTPAAFGVDARGNAVLPAAYKAEKGYVYRLDVLNKMRGGWRKGEGVSTDVNPIYVQGRPGEGVFRSKVDDTQLSTGRNAANQPGGKDRLTKAAVAPENIEMLDANGNWVSLGEDPMTKIMAKDFPELVRQRIVSGVPHTDPEIEGYMQALSKWVQESIGGELGGRTRADLRKLVEAVPTDQATSFNRSQALVVRLLKQKIEEAQSDIFRLAEMQTQRTVLERSLNHPLFALYPSSYMWGKVLPETVKFLSKNPYAATYLIADVQRAIAIQREYNPDIEAQMSSVDRSAFAFLLDYLTPSLPWSDHSARLSPMVRDLAGGKFLSIAPDELSTVSPVRWGKQVLQSLAEIPGAIDAATAPSPTPQIDALKALAGAPAPAATSGEPTQITGPTKASALAPILQDDLSRLSSILLEGKQP